MYNPLRILRQQLNPTYLGVDIGTTSIKVVEARQGSKLPAIVNYGLLESQASLVRANTVLQSSSLKLFDEQVAELLRRLMAKMKPTTTEVVASIPGFSVFMTTLALPEMSASELQRTMAFQAKQYIPLPLSEVAIDWMKVGEYQDDKGFRYQQIFLISVPQEEIRKYQKIFKGAGLRLNVLEIEGLSVVRSVVGNDPTPTLVVDIGSRSTSIVIAEGGQLKFSAQSDFAGATLTQALASSLNVNPLRAEELKRERGIAGTGPNYELSTIMVPFLDAIIQEVKRAIVNYESQFPSAAKAERVVLAGGGTNLLGIEKYASDALGIPAVKAAPLLRFEYSQEIEPAVGELNPLLAVACGLALRELV